jgi:SP family general alpha glucoside:H+ symporter-like MFS transporter
MVIGRAGYVAGGIIMNQLKPRMLNADGWNWGAKSGFFFLGFDVAFFIYLFFYLPETRNRTTAEIEYMFQNKVPCRKFKGYEIDRESHPMPTMTVLTGQRPSWQKLSTASEPMPLVWKCR